MITMNCLYCNEIADCDVDGYCSASCRREDGAFDDERDELDDDPEWPWR